MIVVQIDVYRIPVYQFVGLQATVTDVLVRVQMLDGTHSSTLVRPSEGAIVLRPIGGLQTLLAENTPA